MDARGAVDRIFRAEAGRLTASLVGLVRDFDLAEELVQDAMVVALDTWPRTGLPDNPAAWLLTTARRRAIDRLRRENVGREKAAELARVIEATEVPVHATDERLRLLFACCHPALRPESQIALTLRTVAGLSVAQISRALLVPEPTIAQRLVRAKKKIREAGIPFRLPTAEELPGRLDQLLAVVYLIFNEGYLSSRGASPQRPDLSDEAEWLASTLTELLPDEPEVLSLLALIRLHLARAQTRFDGDEIVLLADQDRERWDRAKIASALELLDEAGKRGQRGVYQLQARIAAMHATSTSFDETPWHEIVSLYDELYLAYPTAVIALNRAIAIAQAEGVDEGLRALEPLADHLADYAPFHSARSELLRRAGRIDDAIAAAERAVELAPNSAEQRLLAGRIEEMRRA
jgi:RNA polymerase sigma factor (sigma-70 family)